MKRKYSERQMKRIMKQNLEIPENVDQKIKDTYEKLGVPKTVPMRTYRRHRRCVAAAAVLIAASTVTVVGFAANGYFQKIVEQDADKLSYHFTIDYDLTPYDIEVKPGYLPEGYKMMGEDSPYGGKIRNEEEDAGISIIPYNLARLDELTEDNPLSYDHVTEVKKLTIQGMDADMIKTESKSGARGADIFMFNEKEGYAVQVYSDGKLSDDDLEKVAETLEIKVLDTQISYKTEEEKKTEKEQAESMRDKDKEIYLSGVKKENVHSVGEQVHNPEVESLTDVPNMYGMTLDSYGDIRYTVESVDILDSLPASDYPSEYYRDFENEAAPALNEDGTLKPYTRVKTMFSLDGDDATEEIDENVKSKFIVVKMKLQNTRNTEPMTEVDVAPVLTHLTEREDGDYNYPTFSFGPADYNSAQIHSRYMIAGAGAFYFNAPYYTEGTERLKDFTFYKPGAGEELEYTLVYAADEDELDNMCLQFYSGYSDEENRFVQCYVKIS